MSSPVMISHLRSISGSQPFQCTSCGKRFTRQENLRRHSAIHAQHEGRGSRTSIPCEYCSVTFSRSDLRRRHIRKKHPEISAALALSSRAGDLSSTAAAAEALKELSVKTPRGQRSPADTRARSPTEPIFHQELDDLPPLLSSSLPEPSSHSPHPPLPSPSSSFPASRECDSIVSDLSSQSSQSSHSSHPPSWSEMTDTWSLSDAFSNEAPTFMPTHTQTLAGVEAFFDYVSAYLPFLHRPTFDVSVASLPLLLGVLSLGYQYTDDPDADFLPGSGETLSGRCFHRAVSILDSTSDDELLTRVDKLRHIQSCLLLEFCALIFLCGSHSVRGLRLHSRIIGLARSGGLMHPLPSDPESTSDLESLWRNFITGESHKRTLLSVHQIDCMWYHFLSLPRSLSHLEIKHDVPCPESWWQIASAAEWAHRTLTVGPAQRSVRYWELVRRMFSQECLSVENLSTTTLEPYGAANIMLFLQSSVREASGWATMTGRLSMDRVEALKTSLDDVKALIKPPQHPSELIQATCLEATWQIAVLELQSWSPSHTGGVVEGSMDEALVTITSLATSRGFMFNPNTVNLVKPHTDWFLQYLEETIDTTHEAPWVALYAFEAFSVTWQMMHSEVDGAMDVVGVAKGDFAAARSWALKVFARRTRWKLGRLIMSSLATLSQRLQLGHDIH